MFNFLLKLYFLLKKPILLVVLGVDSFSVKDCIYKVIKPYERIGIIQDISAFLGIGNFFQNIDKNILIFASAVDALLPEKLNFFLKNSRLSILVLTDNEKEIVGGNIAIPPNEKLRIIKKMTKPILTQGYLVLNFDIGLAKNIQDLSEIKILTFGFSEGADIIATDIHTNGGVNFKINYKENIVPFWLKTGAGREEIYAVLTAVAAGTALGFNLVEISQALRDGQNLSEKSK